MLHREVGKFGQRAGDLIQRPDPTQISQSGQQRHPAFGLPQVGTGRWRLRINLMQYLRKCCLGRNGQSRSQPRHFARDQPAKVGTAPRRCRQKFGERRAEVAKLDADFGGGSGVKDERLTGQPLDETAIHRANMVRRGIEVNAAAPEAPTTRSGIQVWHGKVHVTGFDQSMAALHPQWMISVLHPPTSRNRVPHGLFAIVMAIRNVTNGLPVLDYLQSESD